MDDGKVYGGLVSSFAFGLFAIWLLVTFWAYFLVAGLIALAVWLAWSLASGRWAVGRIQYRTNRALRQNHAAYERARARMEWIARTHQGWR